MSILKIKDSQGNWVGVPTVKGDTGNGISSAVLNDDYTLTLTFTNGTTYTTPSIRGEKGERGDTPTITASKTGKTTSIYVDGSEVAQIEDGTDGDDGYSPTASVSKSGKVATITITDQNGTTSAQVEDGEDGTDGISPTVTITPITGGHRITITDADGEHSADVMDGTGSVDDVQINGTSIVEDGVANVPIASGYNKLGLVKVGNYGGMSIGSDGEISTYRASLTEVKGGSASTRSLTPQLQHASTFYGLAKSAGDTTQSQSSNAVGNYTEDAKDKIQTMLGISPLIAPHESDPFESAHVIGELFIINGKLYRAKTALTAGEYINEGTNVEVVDTSDVYVKNTDYATSNKAGIVKAGSGLQMQTGNYVDTLAIAKAREVDMKAGSDMYRPIVSQIQHTATFYGLAKASGDSTQSASSNAVGTYTDEAKTAIKQMLGVHDTIDSFVEEITGTDVTITGQPSYRYNCGELYSLSVTPPSSGTIDIRFTSGSTPTVLTLPSTVKMPEWWVEVEANTIYEMCITDGIYCGVMTWAI